MAYGAAFLASLLILSGCLFELRRFCKSTKSGKRHLLLNTDVELNYTVQDPRRVGTPDGKVHVIWDIQRPDINVEALIETSTDEPSSEGISQSLQTLTGSTDIQEDLSVPPTPRTPAGPVSSLQPMFKDGEAVEYFSRQRGCWVPGTVKNSFHRTPEGLWESAVNLRLDNRPLPLANVSLETLRAPLRTGDFVEVRSKGGTWQQAEVCSVQGGGALFGHRYSVRLATGNAAPGAAAAAEGGKSVLERISSSNIRRRFPVGHPVEVYRGSALGWEQAIVAAEADGNGHVAVADEEGGSPELLAPHLLRLRAN